MPHLLHVIIHSNLRLTGGAKFHLKHSSSRLAGKIVSDHQYWTGFTSQRPARVVARLLLWRSWGQSPGNQEVPQFFDRLYPVLPTEVVTKVVWLQ